MAFLPLVLGGVWLPHDQCLSNHQRKPQSSHASKVALGIHQLPPPMWGAAQLAERSWPMGRYPQPKLGLHRREAKTGERKKAESGGRWKNPGNDTK